MNITDFKFSYIKEILFNPSDITMIIIFISFIIFGLLCLAFYSWGIRKSRPITQNEILQLECMKHQSNSLLEISEKSKEIQEKADKFNLNMGRLNIDMTYDNKVARQKRLIIPVVLILFFTWTFVFFSLIAIGHPIYGLMLTIAITAITVAEYYKYDRLSYNKNKEINEKCIIDIFNLVAIYMYKPKNATVIDFILHCIPEPIVLKYDYQLLVSDNMTYSLDEALDKFTDRVNHPAVSKLVTFIKNERNLTKEQVTISLSLLVAELTKALEENSRRRVNKLAQSSFRILLVCFGIFAAIYSLPVVEFIKFIFQEFKTQ